MPLVDDGLKKELSQLYGAPERHYHGLAHIEVLLALAKHHRADLADPEAVEAAIWFHDAVYDSTRKDNEEKSAELATERLSGRVVAERLRRIAGMIEATATHRIPDFADETARRDAALFLDMDLSILGAPPAEFDAYEEAVRQEYGWVDEPTWRAGRAAVLKGFLQRPFIFHSEIFRQGREKQARENIARSLARLG
ncbi:Predicted metal-dependent phosphohydrolase, HD superfamily [Mesorhizobium albiziae]|uniref:Predicted metal-dependent phosphohydrolase, HD superfamily n=1 Tax=Neomesorhizobium albiziae TaxID=335020 RepID=A0A1I3Z3C9_9HYPH|nr:hypothetical protein [Mesorhizobium albiziae]GLS33127.1 hypothetical protein GCM10007937_48380 [Mesorhizobium albiziae]SFK38079.1 Predicted metal-dependent phosphohydrolase, HD superfamily [Mesorhizobium albiziae]